MIIGAAQINVCIGDRSSNLEKCLHYIDLAKDCGIDLLVFPECALTGYVFNNYEEAFQAAQLKGIKSKLLYFPEENHWVLDSQNSLVWQREFYKWLKETL